VDPNRRRLDGCQDFSRLLLQYLRPGLRVLDIGGGKRPLISPELKRSQRLRVFGLDVLKEELDAAPPGAYDETVCCDISVPQPLPEVDLAISRSVTEHVSRPDRMYANVFRALRPGGTTLNFMPNKFAPFALLNVSLPNWLGKRLVDFFYPEKEGQGFRAYYRKCYPSAIRRLLGEIGFVDLRFYPYYGSEYLSFFFPLHLLELAWQMTESKFQFLNVCETFSFSARKPDARGDKRT